MAKYAIKTRILNAHDRREEQLVKSLSEYTTSGNEGVLLFNSRAEAQSWAAAIYEDFEVVEYDGNT